LHFDAALGMLTLPLSERAAARSAVPRPALANSA
jgi:hypothetical protein